jgi:hypothetical protein
MRGNFQLAVDTFGTMREVDVSAKLIDVGTFFYE